jgi:hypothetical protein
MPELALGYGIGFIATLCLVGLHVFLQTQKQKSRPMRQVQANLKKIGLFWSETESSIKNDEAGGEKHDAQKSVKSVLLSGTWFVFLSWLGFFLQLIVMISLRYLAVKRLEVRLFESELAEKDLSAEKSREIATQLMQS